MKNKFLKAGSFAFFLCIALLGIVANDRFDFFDSSRADKLPENIIQIENNETKNLFKVYFFDVGQGDSIYIRTPDEQDILIDGGPDNKVLSELGRAMPFGDNEIDMMILTHPHADHVTGLVEVLRRYKVKQIYYTGALHTAPDYLAWLEEIKNQEIPMFIIKDLFEVKLGEDSELEFIYPRENLVNQKVSNLNDTSIVTRLIYGKTKFLFTGDIEAVSEKEILQSGVDVSADVLKIAHHGSSSSSTEDFLSAVNPSIAVIQVGENNSFGHPSLQTLKRLERFQIKTMRTDMSGTVELFSDGEKVFH
ncbi:MBL fold metallo-hydrolase [Patescibacteria group bacterium]|nr:MBL fold metallo-hydrolase [Patescibacteria group bacterium]